MAKRMRDLMTLEQFSRLPEFKPPLEFYGGRAIQKIGYCIHQSIIRSNFMSKIYEHTKTYKCGALFNEFRRTLGEGSYVFDLAYFGKARIHDPDDAPPDIGIEILSRGQTAFELDRKLRIASGEGLRSAWLIDPFDEKIWIFGKDSEPIGLEPDAHLKDEEVLPNLEFQVKKVFDWLDENY